MQRIGALGLLGHGNKNWGQASPGRLMAERKCCRKKHTVLEALSNVSLEDYRRFYGIKRKSCVGDDRSALNRACR